MAFEAKARVIVDTGDSTNKLADLKAALDSARDSLTSARQANDAAGVKRAEEAVKQAKTAIKDYTKATEESAVALGSLSEAPLKNLESAARRLRGELRALPRDSAEFGEKQKMYAAVTAEVKRAREQVNALHQAQGLVGQSGTLVNRIHGGMRGTIERTTASLRAFRDRLADTGVGKVATRVAAEVSGAFEGMRRVATSVGSKIGKAFSGLGGMLGMGVGSAVEVAKNSIESFKKFEKELNMLQSLTGLSGDSMNYLKDAAKEMAATTTASGVRITSSAEEIVKAFSTMGSMKAELLGNKEALKSVTEQALILAAAAGMETDAAVKGLANTMNQFSAKSEEAGRYINVLAAGSQAGAAGVEEISKSITKFGATAAASNISVEESVGLIETLAEKGIAGEVAGTQLNGVLLKLQKASDEFNPAVVGMQQALDNLANANLSATEKIQLFGEGNYVAGEILISNRDKYNELTKAVTNTNTAVEQGIINTETSEARMAQFRNGLDNIMISLGEALMPALLGIMDAVRPIIEAVQPFIERLGPLFKVLSEWMANTIGPLISWILSLITPIVDAFISLAEYIMPKVHAALGYVAKAFQPVIDAVRAVVSGVKEAVSWFGKLLGLSGETTETAAANAGKAKQAASAPVATTEAASAPVATTEGAGSPSFVAPAPRAPRATKTASPASTPKAGVSTGAGVGKTKEEDPFKVADREINEWEKKRALEIKREYAKGVIDKRAYEEKLTAAQTAADAKRLALREQYGKDTIDIATKITNQEIKLKEEAAAAQAAIDARLAEEQKAKMDADAAARQAQLQMVSDAFGTIAGTAADTLAQMVETGEGSAKDFAKVLITTGLDQLEKIINMAIVQATATSLAQPDSVASFGVSGLARAAIIGGLIKVAFAGIKRLVVSQLYEGNIHEVRGALDGRLYSAPYVGAVGDVSYYPKPTLISERGGELVIDAVRSHRIITTRPDLLQAIRDVPQRYEGSLPSSTAGGQAAAKQGGESGKADAALLSTLKDMRAGMEAQRVALARLTLTLREGISSKISIRQVSELQGKIGAREGQ